jgi:sugar-specific transcriptional regulator TrmB
MSTDNLNQRITEIFRQFGISETTTKIYLTTLKLAEPKVSQIAEYLNVDRTEVYHLLKKLEQLGIVEESLTNPVFYTPKNPIYVIETLLEREEHRLKSIRTIEKNLRVDIKNLNLLNENSNEVGKYILLRGRPRIYSFMEKQVSMSETSLKVLMTENGSNRRFQLGNVYKVMHEKYQQGVDIKIITEVREKNNSIVKEWSKIAEIKYLESIPFDITIYDESSVSLPLVNNDNLKYFEDSHVAIWTNSRSFVNGMSILFNFLWNTARIKK